MVETGVARAGSPRRIRVDPFEVLSHGLNRGVQAVEVQSVEPGLSPALWLRVVVGSQPLDKLNNIGVAPHPPREAPEIAQRLLAIDIVAETAHIAVDAVSVRPVRLDRHG